MYSRNNRPNVAEDEWVWSGEITDDLSDLEKMKWCLEYLVRKPGMDQGCFGI